MKKPAQYNPNTVVWRFYVVLGAVVLIYAGLMARTAYIQVFEPDMLKKQGDNRSLRTNTKTVQRGSIVDRNGHELAISVPVETVWADPKIIFDSNALSMKKHWQALADVLGQDVKKLQVRITKNPTKRFVYIERKVAPAMANYIRELKIPGIHLRKESKRFYPAGEISAHVVGFTNVDDKGIEGIERVYDQLLTGEDGEKQYRKDAKGRKIEILSVKASTPPKEITLSIDQRIQALAYRELKGAVKAFKATSGSAVVTNVNTGEVLALVNSPSYNPNNRSGVAIHRFRNRAITDIYEPGSSVKPLTVLTALEFGSVKKDSIIDTYPGWMRLGGSRVSDPRYLGKITLAELLVHSSNMGTTKLALSVPKDYLIDKFFDAGFSEETGTGLVGESSGMMHDRARWSKFELATLSWGHGVAITPIQLARFYTILANGGMKIPLTILKQDPQEQVKKNAERIFSAENSQNVLDMLEHVVNEHYTVAKIDGYRVGGKSGTAIKAFAGGYGNDYVGLFAGVAPISDPEIAVVVVIDDPGGDLYHGGEVAAPVFSRIMKGTLRLLNVAPDANTKVTVVTAEPKTENLPKERDHV
ncbi:peptidoglycan glycosyltransferase FtsI [Colwellia sp. M166]|uniref:peptidoglycan D,D-transpeptidase FtsI family protein n=1 Tax=Colwellia sp. M166 TaxID=2583805 RepID=UPI00211E25B2|nr:penicillin-binding transpeptidase domain-containing protein [Colwellia sp. M166]UUO24133.1 peptidoglycan glycosyltransferase FtsI [Colwellia sp. M166]|tara:strand:+ start:14348 stop:16105 length:1758 start_codon:yes stop_codon:yes gene_type:complete